MQIKLKSLSKNEDFKNLLRTDFVNDLKIHKEKIENFGLQKLNVLALNSQPLNYRGSTMLSKFPDLLKMLWYYR